MIAQPRLELSGAKQFVYLDLSIWACSIAELGGCCSMAEAGGIITGRTLEHGGATERKRLSACGLVETKNRRKLAKPVVRTPL